VPARIQKIEQFGTIDFAASKLLAAEKAKPITQASSVLSTRTFELPTGTAYQIEYEVTQTGTFREHSANIQGTFRENSGNIQRTFREHSANIQ
jgi:hypothetical protein